MPHFAIEYSSNLESDLDMPALCALVASTASRTGVFPLAGIRVRTHKADHVYIADGHPKNAFCHIICSVGHGRTPEVRAAAGDAIFEAVEEFCAEMLEQPHFLLSMEIREIDPATTWKRNTIKPRLEETLS